MEKEQLKLTAMSLLISLGFFASLNLAYLGWIKDADTQDYEAGYKKEVSPEESAKEAIPNARKSYAS